MAKIQKAVRLPNDMAHWLVDYAEAREISEADALRRLIRIARDSEESQPVIEDNGFVTTDRSPWVEPLIEAVYGASGYSLLLLLAGLVAGVLPQISAMLGVVQPLETTALIASLTVLLAAMGTILAVVAVVAVLLLEAVMHPTQAPIRRHLPRTWPSKYKQAGGEE